MEVRYEVKIVVTGGSGFIGTQLIERWVEEGADVHALDLWQSPAMRSLVRSGRGRSGGLKLSQPASEITGGRVVELFEGPVALLDCISVPGACIIQPGCRLRNVLQQAGMQLMETLNGVTLEELVAPPGPSLIKLAPVEPPVKSGAE